MNKVCVCDLSMFFFCMEKTAYEMRISYCSSDVYSFRSASIRTLASGLLFPLSRKAHAFVRFGRGRWLRISDSECSIPKRHELLQYFDGAIRDRKSVV